ncbi:MAG: penicillin-binding protein activator LpoB [Chitinispirillales bacterium]|jgi:hypothetical protein|nr:penicillin-binding protein activator LpoB [Chitinispirillales bacterium]
MTALLRSFVKCAVALCVLSAAAFGQSKPKAAVYIMGNPEGRDAIRSAVNTSLIKSGKYQMIAVDAIDLVAQEQKRQMSGSVSDGDIAALGRDAGAEYVCVVQRSELDGTSYVATRMVSVQSKVAEFADMVELPPGGKIIDIIQWQIGSMLGMPVGPRPAVPAASGYSAVPASQYSEQTAAAASGKTEPVIQGTAVPGGSLAQKLAWLQKSADSHNTYIVDVNADERIAPQKLEYKGAVNVTVVLRGIGGNRTVRLSSKGTMFDVRENVTLVLDNNITLRGHSGNDNPYRFGCVEGMVSITSGTLKMNNGAAIVDNPSGAVSLYSGTFEMTGGLISGNSTPRGGGGVCINQATFTMTGGIISGNKATRGGGVNIGQYLATFNMRDGLISGNTAAEYGGGVFWGSGTSNFTKTGGTIIGHNSDPVNGNTVKDEEGNVLARKGHAIYYSIYDSKRKETTAGPKDNFSRNGGAWDQ